MSTEPVPYDAPHTVATRVLALPRPTLIGLDVDGVLAPIVDHADDARLLDGMSHAVESLAARDDVHVAVLSGRAIADLERFAFPDRVTVIGSHGMETRDQAMLPLDAAERDCLDELTSLAENAADAAGAGSWVEHKPASVVLHVRQADPQRGRRAIDALTAAALLVPDATQKPGSGVVELFARAASKGSALRTLAEDLGVASTVFVGDDRTDEDAFAVLGADDLAIKVGDSATIATLRLADPDSVLDWLRLLVD